MELKVTSSMYIEGVPINFAKKKLRLVLEEFFKCFLFERCKLREGKIE
jgi:hypothetical protein